MSSSSRREFITRLASVGPCALFPEGAMAWAQRPPATPSGLIDVHHHILPPLYMAEARERVIAQGQGFLPACVLEWTPARAIAEMEENGVATAIVSISTPGVSFGSIEGARALARKCNEYAAQLVRDHPGRFGFFAVLPLPDVEGSLRETAYALDVLKADGAGMMTSFGDTWPGDVAYVPLLEELNRRKAVVYVHPTGPNCCRDLISYVPYVFTELPHDTTRAITSLLFAGAFGRWRDTRFIFSHAGGTLPMVAGRIARQSRAMKELAAKLPNGVEFELRRLYYEIGGSANRPAMAALTSLIPVSQILFGSDYPWGRIATTAAGMADLGFSSGDLQAIGRTNATMLFARSTKSP